MELSLKELAEFTKTNQKGSDCNSHWEIGKVYLIRTVTMMNVGVLDKVTNKELVLTKAAWIADSGRFSESLLSGNFSEVEMFLKDKPVIIGRGAIVDAQQIDIDLDTLKTK